jgi:tetratricopeptide (TPR) repeat protein
LISIVLPRVVVGFAGLAGTIGVLAVFAIIFAYFIAYYDESQDPQVSVSTSAVSTIMPNPVLDSGLGSASQSEADLPYEAPAAEDAELAATVDSMPIALYQEESPLFVVQQPKEEEELLPETLDELMELAFKHKEELNFTLALKCFREALKQFPESEAAPFLVVEVANILKNRGSYDEAIKIFTDGRNLPGLQQDDTLAQEFIETIAYLRIVRNTLLERRLGFIPYHKIPVDVCRDIDVEFREWRNLA